MDRLVELMSIQVVPWKFRCSQIGRYIGLQKDHELHPLPFMLKPSAGGWFRGEQPPYASHKPPIGPLIGVVRESYGRIPTHKLCL